LSVSGERKLSILTRSVETIRLEVSRVLPGNLSHLVSQSSGPFQAPEFRDSWRYRYGQDDLGFGFDDLSEGATDERTFAPDPTGKNHYTELDFTWMLAKTAVPRGLFWLVVQEWDSQQKKPVPQGAVDRRLILLTDLGLVVKDAADGTHEAFVQ